MTVPRYLGRTFLMIAPALVLSGCAVGPDFERPPAPDVKTYESTPLPAKTESAPIRGGNAQNFVTGNPIPTEWWTAFHSEPLNRLIALSLKHNPDLAAAEASLREAQENTLAGYGELLPAVDAGANVQRQKISGIAFGSNANIPPFTVYTGTVSVSYGLDIFGGARRAIEALSAAEDYQRYEMEAARISLAANVVTAAVQEASLRAQIEATRKIIQDEKKNLDVLENQFKLGGIAKSGYLAQAANLAQAEATLPPLEKQLAQTRHLLSVLAGQFPSDEPKGKFELASLTLPLKLPLSLPSQLVDQRPDVRAAEATLRAASAEIGVATANMLPQFTISGDIGTEIGTLASLFAPGTGIWSLAAGVSQPIFHGGELLHKRRASEAAYDEAAAIYRKTVLAAFQDVADTLHALKSDAEALKAQADAERAADESLQLTEQQYKDGAVPYVTLLTAEQTENQARLLLVQAEARRYTDTAALFTALGGGWWNKPMTGNEATNTEPSNDSAASTATTNINNAGEDSSAVKGD